MAAAQGRAGASVRAAWRCSGTTAMCCVSTAGTGTVVNLALLAVAGLVRPEPHLFQ